MAIGLLLAALPFLVIGLSLGFLGGGGSILTVPVLVYGMHMEPKTAIATSLIVVGVTSLLGAVRYALSGKLDWRTGGVFGMAGMAGAYAGGRIAAYLPAFLLLLMLALMMLVTAVAMLRGRRPVTAKPGYAGGAALAAEPMALPVRTLATGIGVGSVTGLVGAGGGFMIVPALVLLEGMDMGTAIATSLMVIAMNSFAGLLGYIQHVHIAASLVVTITLFSVVGCIAGCLLATRVKPEALRKGFGVFILLVAVYLVYKQAGTLGLA